MEVIRYYASLNYAILSLLPYLRLDIRRCTFHWLCLTLNILENMIGYEYGNIDFKNIKVFSLHHFHWQVMLDHRYYSIAMLRQWEGECLLCSGPNWCRLSGTQATVSTPLSGSELSLCWPLIGQFPPSRPLIGRYSDWSALFSGQAPAPVRKLTENHNCECQVRRTRENWFTFNSD